MITVFHGIGAYRGQKNPVALSNQLSVALSGVEICAADRPIGAFGAVVSAAQAIVWPRDVYSFLDRDGHRSTDVPWSKATVCGGQADAEGLFMSFSEVMDPLSYCEVWIMPTILRAMWVKPWADAKTMRAAEIIAAHRGVPLLVVRGTTRIWDILDSGLIPSAVYTTKKQEIIC
jgi:hypothetical protein